MLLGIFCILFIPSILYAGSLSNYESEQQRMLTLVENIYSKFKTLPVDNKDLSSISLLFLASCQLPSPKSYQAKALHADAERYEDDLGLEFRGRFSHSFSGTGLDDTSTGNEESGAQGYVELSWDVLRSGYFENQGRAQALYKESQLAELSSQIKSITNSYRCRRYKLAQNFTGFISQILSLRLSLMESITAIERRAYFKGWSQFDELLVSEDELVRIRHELDYIHSSPYFDHQITSLLNPPLIDINMKKVALAMRNDHLQPQVANLKKDVLESKEDARYRNRLRFFIREGLIEDDQFGQGNASVGVSFNIPLVIENEDSLKYRLLAVESEAKLEDWERLTRVRYAYSLVRYQQKQVIKQHYRYQRALEMFRQSNVSLRLDYESDNDLIIAITRLRTLLDAAFELIEVKKELYWRVNEVFLTSRIEFQPDFIQLYGLPTEDKRGRTWDRSLYVWSKSFNIFSNPDIFDFLQAKGINNILFSASKKINHQKMNSFLQQAKKTNLHVEMMIGSNEWIFPKNHQRAVTSSLITAEKYGAIHFDIEPHTFKDFKQRKNYYLENYIAMLSAIRKKIPNQPLTVAVPLHWSKSFYKKTARLVDGVYVMAYGTNKPKTLIRRLHPLIQQLGVDKVTVILRLKDYEDEWQLEQMIDQLNQSLGIKQFGFENLANFFKLASQRP